jgi:hypothetical protein
MNDERRTGPLVPTERPDREAAERKPEAGRDRPGFDLGGAKGAKAGSASRTIPDGPKGSVSDGTDASGRAAGLTDPSGSRSLGNRDGAGSATGSGSTDGPGSARDNT